MSPLTTYLGAVELRGRVETGAVAGHVDEPVDIVLGNGLGYPLGSLDVDVLQGEVPARVLAMRPFGLCRVMAYLVG